MSALQYQHLMTETPDEGAVGLEHLNALKITCLLTTAQPKFSLKLENILLTIKHNEFFLSNQHWSSIINTRIIATFKGFQHDMKINILVPIISGYTVLLPGQTQGLE